MGISQVRERALSAPTKIMAQDFLNVCYIFGDITLEDVRKIKQEIKEEWDELDRL